MEQKPIDVVQQWDDDGGAQLGRSVLTGALEHIDEEDKVILEFLGASLLSLWDDLPSSQQQRLLNIESVKEAFERGEIKTRVQRIEAYLNTKK